MASNIRGRRALSRPVVLSVGGTVLSPREIGPYLGTLLIVTKVGGGWVLLASSE